MFLNFKGNNYNAKQRSEVQRKEKCLINEGSQWLQMYKNVAAAKELSKIADDNQCNCGNATDAALYADSKISVLNEISNENKGNGNKSASKDLYEGFHESDQNDKYLESHMQPKFHGPKKISPELESNAEEPQERLLHQSANRARPVSLNKRKFEGIGSYYAKNRSKLQRREKHSIKESNQWLQMYKNVATRNS